MGRKIPWITDSLSSSWNPSKECWRVGLSILPFLKIFLFRRLPFQSNWSLRFVIRDRPDITPFICLLELPFPSLLPPGRARVGLVPRGPIQEGYYILYQCFYYN